MRSSLKKNLLLLLYAWFIYNTFIFVAVPFMLVSYNLSNCLYLFVVFLSSYIDFYFILAFRSFLLTPEGMFIMCNLLFISGLALYLFWERQTLARAWALALAGMCSGPGLAFAFPEFDLLKLSVGICVNLLFISLMAANHLQKKHWPDNKWANRLRGIMKWPCIST